MYEKVLVLQELSKSLSILVKNRWFKKKWSEKYERCWFLLAPVKVGQFLKIKKHVFCF